MGQLPFSALVATNLYEQMLRIRLVEEAIAEEYPKQEMKCPIHLSIGQEAISAGVSECLTEKDIVLSNHRSHGHYLAKGGDLSSFIAELYGKNTGCSKGKGGSMHLLDINKGFYGSTAIVGGNIPMAAGIALAIQNRKESHIAVAYFGDGATEEGVLYETLNFSALHKLPILFICENNFFSVLTRIEERQPKLEIYKKMREFGVRAEKVDGNDVSAIYQACKLAVQTLREGKGPFFLEAQTYRWKTHCGPQWDEPDSQRPKKELQEWMDRCPIKKWEEKIKKYWGIPESKIQEYRRSLLLEISEAFQIAKSSPYPNNSEMMENIYE